MEEKNLDFNENIEIIQIIEGRPIKPPIICFTGIIK